MGQAGRGGRPDRAQRRRDVTRFFLLVFVSIGGMALMMQIPYLLAVWALPPPLDWDVVLFLSIVGGVVGVFTMPAVVGFLKEADLRKALPAIYIPAVAATSAWAWFSTWPGVMFTPFVAWLAVCITSPIAARLFPINPFMCRKCGYNLRGLNTDGCPECGEGR